MTKTFFRASFSDGATKAQVTIGILEYSILDEDRISHLSKHETTAYGKLKVENRRKQFIAGRYIAKECISKSGYSIPYDRIDIVNGVWGFPLLHSDGLQSSTLSIAHSDHFAAASFFADDTHPMGIDIEDIREGNIKSLHDFMSSKERELISLSEMPHSQALHMIWSAKEAAGKAIRTGFHIPESCYEISCLHVDGDFINMNFSNIPILKAMGWLHNDTSICIAFPSAWNLESIERE